ncbi:unnamed protein product (macronuclear) [Paramecium tetraurelia]|uniref:Myb-like domain-containing protein n=1 Tax=Paramecium tetraurelia TaxID=5888 RepID=A0E8T8_PARTE|nr:uncharacterized protein GSPATT00024435001 [Paramecium tetraurelia]CAK91705.1 unnamed protein product [Paramecium tetraurelia]|eukprot:XP_001459102.1 hypothetical protein (macronuclear) [Paramecium tetraurelia strain d4-2]
MVCYNMPLKTSIYASRLSIKLLWFQLQKNDQDANSQNKSQQEQINEQKKMQLDLGIGSSGQIQNPKKPSSIVSPTDNYFQLNDEKEQEKEKLFDFQGDEELKLNQKLVKDQFKQRQYNEEIKEGLEKEDQQEKIEPQWIQKSCQDMVARRRLEIEKTLLRTQEYLSMFLKMEKDQSKISELVILFKCKQRWIQDEDTKLVSMVALEGKNWTKLARHFQEELGNRLEKDILINQINFQFCPMDRLRRSRNSKILQLMWCKMEFGSFTFKRKISIDPKYIGKYGEEQVLFKIFKKIFLGRYKIKTRQYLNKACISQTIERNKNIEVEYSDISNNDMKLFNSENYSSSIGQCKFPFYYYENNVFYENLEYLIYNICFDREFDKKQDYFELFYSLQQYKIIIQLRPENPLKTDKIFKDSNCI